MIDLAKISMLNKTLTIMDTDLKIILFGSSK